MIEINLNKRAVLDHLSVGETFQLADTFYQKTDQINGPYLIVDNLKTGELTKLRKNQTVIPKNFVLTLKEESNE